MPASALARRKSHRFSGVQSPLDIDPVDENHLIQKPGGKSRHCRYGRQLPSMPPMGAALRLPGTAAAMNIASFD